MKKLIILAAILGCAIGAKAADPREGLSEYKLPNGLTVMLWEDHDQPDVTGYVVVRAGSIDEPQEYTGLAHYLEHMLFKGTQRIGALDWAAEKPIYDSIIALYDQYAEATDPMVRQDLATQINQCSMREAKISTTEEFFNLLDLIGAEGVNAYTSYDVTCYHNSFPAAEMYRWLTIFSDRLINPVFRTFQAELENVFEEYNMYANDPQRQVSNTMFEKVYSGHPYERNIIGKPEHLKNPRLSKLIEFYNTWYVPNNMALILVGDFNSEEVKPMIAETFSRLEAKELPARGVYPVTDFTGNPSFSYRMGYNPMVIWAYQGVKVTDEDADALQFVCLLLSNGTTGLLDKLTIDGDVQFAGVSFDARRDQGRILVQAVPYFDANQRQFESDKATEKIIMAEINKLKTGNIADWQIESVKKMYDQSYKTEFESSSAKMQELVNCFTYGIDKERIFTTNAKIQALTKEEIARVAKKYFDADHLTLSFDEGNVKPNTLPKPKIEPLDPVKSAETEYGKAFKQLPKGTLKQTFNNLSEVQVSDVADHIKLHHTPNTKNNIFTLTLRYGIGSDKMPMLDYVTTMMNYAGIQPATEAQEFNRQMAALGAEVSYGCSDSYFTISISGEDEHLHEIMNLVNRQLLFPKLDQKQLDNIKSQVFFSRLTRTKRTPIQKSALVAYALYGDKSPYIDEVPFGDIWRLGLPQIQSEIAKARTYALDIFYCGTIPADKLVTEMPLTEGMRASQSPIVKDRKSYDKTTVLFLPAQVQQADLYFYINGRKYDIASDVTSDAFNQYMSGGFTGVVMNEIRVKRSMAYAAYGVDATPILQGKDCYFMGYVGTQNDKVVDAIDVYMNILENMPVDSTNIDGLRTALRQAAQTAKPSMRGKAGYFDRLATLGYTDDPAKVNKQKIDDLTFAEIEQFYKDNIQGKPVTIVLMGDPKKIDLKAIEKRMGCKVTKVSPTRLFADLDLDF